MKLNGVKIKGPNVVEIIIPRGDGLPIVLKAQAILDMDEYDRLCPMPEPPKKLMAGGARVPNFEDEHYVSAISLRGEQKMAYITIASLQATEGLEWEGVKLSDPSTWSQVWTELKEAGFSEFEISRIRNKVMEANCLDESKVEEARKRFLAHLAEANVKSSSLTDELSSSPSGEPANAS